MKMFALLALLFTAGVSCAPKPAPTQGFCTPPGAHCGK